jgi:hypothetical protein
LQRLIDHAADSNVSLLDAVRALSIGNASKNAKLLAFADLIDELILGIEQVRLDYFPNTTMLPDE